MTSTPGQMSVKSVHDRVIAQQMWRKQIAPVPWRTLLPAYQLPFLPVHEP